MAECGDCKGTGDGKHVYEPCQTCGGRGTERTPAQEAEDFNAVREQRENAVRVLSVRLIHHMGDCARAELPPTPLCPYRITIEAVSDGD